jgi:hypothetical protein
MDAGYFQSAQLGDLDGLTLLVLVEESEHGFLDLTPRPTPLFSLAAGFGRFTAGSIILLH